MYIQYIYTVYAAYISYIFVYVYVYTIYICVHFDMWKVSTTMELIQSCALSSNEEQSFYHKRAHVRLDIRRCLSVLRRDKYFYELKRN